jgi:hypothetical protein
VRVRLIPRLSSKQKIWPGGPELGEVVQAQLSPPGSAAAAGLPPAIVPPVGPAPLLRAPAPAPEPPPEVKLLLVLR